MIVFCSVVFFQAEDGIRDLVRSRGLGDVYKRQRITRVPADPAAGSKAIRRVAQAAAAPLVSTPAPGGMAVSSACALSLIHI